MTIGGERRREDKILVVGGELGRVGVVSDFP